MHGGMNPKHSKGNNKTRWLVNNVIILRMNNIKLCETGNGEDISGGITDKGFSVKWHLYRNKRRRKSKERHSEIQIRGRLCQRAACVDGNKKLVPFCYQKM